MIVAEDTRVARRLLSAHGITGPPAVDLSRAQRGDGDRARSSTRAATAGRRRDRCRDAGDQRSGQCAGRRCPSGRRRGRSSAGPTAFACAAVLSGFDVRRFTFEGFPPRTPGRARRSPRPGARAPERLVRVAAPHRRRARRSGGGRAEGADVRGARIHQAPRAAARRDPGRGRGALPDPVLGEVAFVIDAGEVPADGPSIDEQIDVLRAARRRARRNRNGNA